jgi:mevalonate kinase
MAIGELMNENQELLESLGVSSPELERLIQAVRQAGALGAKLSGAGWGGNMIALAEPQVAAAIAQALTQAGAVKVITTEVASSI